MNRVIKFRAWDGEVMQSVGLLSFLQGGIIAEGAGSHIGGGDSFVDGEKIVLMQFIGLLDKNGKEIHEGDIVKNRYDVAWKILWDDVKDDQWALFGAWNEWPQFRLTQKQIKNQKLEIVGNIYENPDLLTTTHTEKEKN